MSINKNARYVLKTPGDGRSHISVSAIRNFSFCGGNEYTISFCMYYSGYGNNVIFEQDRSFVISIVDDTQLVFTTAGFEEKVSLSDISVAKNDFNFFDITYDKSKLRIYVNGALFKETAVTGRAVSSAEPIKIGRGYYGYISKFKIANYPLSQSEIAKNTYSNSIEASKLEADIDFTAPKPIDRSKNKLTCNPVSACGRVNVARTLAVRDSGYVRPEVSPVITAAFTVCAKIYLTENKNETGVIFSYGDYGGSSSFCLGVRNTSGNYAFVKCCGTAFVMSEPLPVCRWIDLAVTSDGTGVRLYVDGIEKASAKSDRSSVVKQGKAYIGNCVINGAVQKNGFPGYIDSVSLFSAALTPAEISRIMECPPFIFTKKALAVYNFNVHDPYDLISISLLVNISSSVIMAENTVDEGGIPEFDYDYDKGRVEMTAFERWGATALLDMAALFMQAEHGLTLRYAKKTGNKTDYPDALLAYTVKNILYREESQLALSGYNNPDINQKNISRFISMLCGAGFVLAIGAALCKGYAATLNHA